MRFWVRVPVLSEQTTLTQPRVSTLGRRLTMVFTFTMRETLKASTMVTTAGRPSGTAATAREMAVISISITSRCWSTATPKRRAHSATETALKSFPRSASRFWRGVVSAGVSPIIRAMRPISVSMPMAVTTPSPRP